MKQIHFVCGVLALVLAPLAAQAKGRCILTISEKIDSARGGSLMILADNLDVPANAKEVRYISNDKSLQLQIKRITAAPTSSEVQANVYLNEAMIMRSTGTAQGSLVGTSTAVSLPDGRGLTLNCIAQDI